MASARRLSELKIWTKFSETSGVKKMGERTQNSRLNPVTFNFDLESA